MIKITNDLKINVFANAKINLFLKVIKKNNNYHELISLMIPYFDLQDKIEIIIKPSLENKIKVINKGKYTFNLKNNSIINAINLLKENVQFNNDILIVINKNIPIGSGLGGASSDATCVFLALLRNLKINLDIGIIKEILIKLGSDCLFFYYNQPSILKGEGNKIMPINYLLENKFKLIINKEINLTKNIFLNHKINNKSQDKLAKILYLIKNKKQISSNLFFNDLDETINNLNQKLKAKYLNQTKKHHTIYTGSGSAMITFNNRK